MERKGVGSADVGNVNTFTSDEKIAWFFQPDTLLSAQYFDTLRRKTLLEPEKRLMVAILDDAIHCYQDNLFSQSGKNKRLFDEAEEWIVTAGGDWMFCFDNVCESLGFNPEYVRRGLLRWKEKNRQTHSRSGTWGEQLAS
jgi:hypothetical protein